MRMRCSPATRSRWRRWRRWGTGGDAQRRGTRRGSTNSATRPPRIPVPPEPPTGGGRATAPHAALTGGVPARPHDAQDGLAADVLEREVDEVRHGIDDNRVRVLVELPLAELAESGRPFDEHGNGAAL